MADVFLHLLSFYLFLSRFYAKAAAFCVSVNSYQRYLGNFLVVFNHVSVCVLYVYIEDDIPLLLLLFFVSVSFSLFC